MQERTEYSTGLRVHRKQRRAELTAGSETKYMVVALVVVFIAYAIFQIVRASPAIETVAAFDSDYTKDNHILRVYTAPNELNLRTSTDFRESANNINDQLEAGALFFVSDKSKGLQRKTIVNYPKNNVSEHVFQKINVIQGGKRVERIAALSYASYVGNEQVSYDQGLRGSPLVDRIYSELIAAGWNGKRSFKSNHFSYVDGGHYGTELMQSVNLYDKHGDQIGQLPKGAIIFGTMAVPFATGREDPTLMRITGYNTQGRGLYLEEAGLYFVDLYANERKTIATSRAGE